MTSKTLGTLLIVIVCILLFPVAIGIIGGIFGIVIGIIGAVFGAIAGVIGGIFGAIFGVFGWIFDGIFDWDMDRHFHFPFFRWNVFSVAALVLIIVLLTKSRPARIK